MYHPRCSSFGSLPGDNSGARAGAAPRGQALRSLAGAQGLRDHFFSWRGASGRRYVCSVFQAGEDGFVADVTNGVVIGVAREGSATRPVCVFVAEEEGRRDRYALRRMAREFNVSEWHVHFCADAATMRDLSASLLN